MSTVVLLLATGLGLGALYFLVASGLSLIYGLMHVLNFAHGAFLTLGAFLGYAAALQLDATSWTGFIASIVVGALVGAVFATLTELLLIRPLYERHIEQVLVTVGLSLATVALFEGIWGTDPDFVRGPAWLDETTGILGARIPNDRFLHHRRRRPGAAWRIVVFLNRTRYGMVIRAGVENRAMVTALGIDVRRSFTLVFAIGGAAAGLGGVLAAHYFGYVSPSLGGSLLIFAFIVTVIGGLGSLTGAAVASVLVALLQQFAELLRGRHRRLRHRARPGRGAAGPTVRSHGEGSLMRTSRILRLPMGVGVGVVFVAVLAILPLLSVQVPGILPGPTYTPGALQLLALAMVYASLALSYNLLLGTGGLLSFGHALYFGAGAYGLGILLERTDLSLWPAIGLTLAMAGGIALVTGAVSLRVSRHPVRDGDPGLRPGRLGAGASQPRWADRRRRGSVARHRARA